MMAGVGWLQRIFLRNAGIAALPNELVIPPRRQWAGDPIGLPTVWACVRLINTTITQMPVTARTGNRPSEVPLWLRRPELGPAQMIQRDLVSYAVVSMALRGYAAWWATPVGLGWEVEPLHPARVGAELDDRRTARRWYLDGQRVELAYPASTPELRLPGLLIAPHLLHPDVALPIGPLQAARIALEGFLEVDGYASTIISTGRGESGNYLSTTQEMTSDTARRWSRQWVDGVEGGGIRVLGGGLELRNTLLNPADAQWLESREFNAQEVARLFNMPPRYLGLPSGDASTYATARDNDASLLRYCVGGYTSPVSAAWSSLLPSGVTSADDQRITFDAAELLQPTPQELNQADALAIGAGIESVDEVRARRALPPIRTETARAAA